jgi:hypothetical protein
MLSTAAGKDLLMGLLGSNIAIEVAAMQNVIKLGYYLLWQRPVRTSLFQCKWYAQCGVYGKKYLAHAAVPQRVLDAVFSIAEYAANEWICASIL